MKKFDKLYTVRFGELVTYVFLEESVAAVGCSPTWVVRELRGNRRIRCAVGSYHQTPKAAWEAERDYVAKTLTGLEDQQRQLTSAIVDAKQNLERITKIAESIAA